MLTIRRIPTIVSIYQDGVERPGCRKNCLGTCCIPGAKLPVYAFRGNFVNELSDSESDDAPGTEGSSLFLDAIVLAQWEERLARGLFRYDVTACETKVLPGEFGFVAQLNEGRHLKKRPTEFRVDQVLQPFDPMKFNFTKVGQEEVLFCFEESIDGSHGYSEGMVVGKSPNVVAINVSPIEYGHVLLVPKLLDCKPQQIDQASFRLAVSFAAEAQNLSFRVGYNSLGAFATINHLHFQAYYLAVPFPVERAAVKKIGANKKNGGVKIFELTNYAVKGLVYESNGNLNELADSVAKACIVLQERNVPFNVLIADCGRRIFLFPQCFAEKQALGQVDQDILDTQVNPAVWEISGHIVLKQRGDYDSATEDYAWRLLAEVSLSEDRFADVKRLCLDAAWKQEDVSLKDSLFSYMASESGVKLSDKHGGSTKQSNVVPVESSIVTDICCV